MMVEQSLFSLLADMEKAADTQTLSAEIFENCGNFWIVKGYSLLMVEKKNLINCNNFLLIF